MNYHYWVHIPNISNEYAACIISGINPENYDKFSNKKIKEIAELLASVSIINECHGKSTNIFDYTEEAIKKQIEIHQDLSTEIQRAFFHLIEADQISFTRKYPYITRELSLVIEKDYVLGSV